MDYYRVAWPFIRLFEPETAHRLAIVALKTGLLPRSRKADPENLSIQLWGKNFSNPLGVAAGFDKNAEVPDALVRQGFGFVELGAVTPRPQDGNPRPRVFRLLEDEAVINRMGFNNDGIDVVRARLQARQARPRESGPIGMNLGKNKDTVDAAADYEKGVEAFASLTDYLVINVSSPNTPGLRALQSKDALCEIIGRSRAKLDQVCQGIPHKPALLLKIAPDLTIEERREIAEVALEGALDGMIISNSTIKRDPALRSKHAGETGGLGGRPLFLESTALLREMYTMTEGRIPLIGVGGVSSGKGAYAKIRAGASLVQIYTSLVYHGLPVIERIKSELSLLLHANGHTCLADAVGADIREGAA